MFEKLFTCVLGIVCLQKMLHSFHRISIDGFRRFFGALAGRNNAIIEWFHDSTMRRRRSHCLGCKIRIIRDDGGVGRLWGCEVYPRPVDAILAFFILYPAWMNLRNVERVLRGMFFDDRKEMSTGDARMTTFKAGANLKLILTYRHKPAPYWTKFSG